MGGRGSHGTYRLGGSPLRYGGLGSHRGMSVPGKLARERGARRAERSQLRASRDANSSASEEKLPYRGVGRQHQRRAKQQPPPPRAPPHS